MRGKTAFITGGSSGIGKEIGKQLAGHGAHITIFARRQSTLDEAKKEILASRVDESQEVNAVSVDAADAAQIEAAFKIQSRLPDFLYCSAGNTSFIGFLPDLEASALDYCMKANYYTAAYSAQALLQLWLEDDREVRDSVATRTSRIVFINSAAALFPFPGYIAYSSTGSKCAVRAFADTLRMELLRYSGPSSRYTVHCTFPNSIMTPSFFEEQKIKPRLTKQIEGTTGSTEELLKQFPSTEKAVRQIISGVEHGEFGIADDSFDSSLLYATSLGTSPKRGLGIFDAIVGVLCTLIAWPIYQYYFDYLVTQDNIWKRWR